MGALGVTVLLTLLMLGETAPGMGAPQRSRVEQRKQPAAAKGTWIDNIQLTSSYRGDNGQPVEVQGRLLVYLPACYQHDGLLPLAIVLHGWSQRPEDWREQTDVAVLADTHCVVLALPAMGNSVYEASLYRETTAKWNQMPGARWIASVVLPYMRDHFAVSPKRRLTAVIGVSTGGRGAVVLSERFADFSFCASLSGTYDLSLLGEDQGEYKIHRAVFGDRNRFRDRWRSEDCLNASYAQTLKSVYLYLAHGDNDPIVPVTQLQAMKQFLATFHHHYQAVTVKGAGHSWAFWNSQLGPVFDAMERAFRIERTPQD